MDPIEPWVDRDELRRLADALLAAPTKPLPDPPNDAAYGEQFEGFTGGEPEPAPARPAKPAPSPGQAARQAAAEIASAAEAHQLPAHAPEEPIIHRQAKHVLANARQIAQRGGMLDAVREAAAEETAPEELEPAPAAAPPTDAPAPIAAELTQVLAVPGAEPPAAEAKPPPLPPSGPVPFLERLRTYGAWLRQAAGSQAFFLVDREGGVLIDEVQSPQLQRVARTLAQASRTANRQAGAAAIGNLHVKIAADRILEVVPVTTRYGLLILGIILERPLGPQNAETVARALQQAVDANSGA